MTISVPARLPLRSTRARGRATPELELLIQCARLHMGREQQARAHALLQQGLEADRLTHLASHHNMVPLLYWHLQELAADLDGRGPLYSLRVAFMRNAQRMLKLTAELLEIIWLFEERGILAVPYKGSALAAQLYGNLTLRQAGDLDLLVRRADVSRARALLIIRGYRPLHSLSSPARALMLKSRYSETFVGTNAVVELHWAFTNRDVALPLGLDDLVARLETICLGGQTVRVFGLEDLLIILCAHGAKHRWDRLEWLCGVAEVVRRLEDIDWEGLVERASSLGARRMLQLGLVLSHELLDAPIPADVLRRARGDRAVVDLAAQVRRMLAEHRTETKDLSLDVDLFRLRLRERTRDRLRFILHRLTTPSRPERWSLVPFGNRWIPLHAILRPFRLLFKALPAVRWYVASAWRRAD